MPRSESKLIGPVAKNKKPEDKCILSSGFFCVWANVANFYTVAVVCHLACGEYVQLLQCIMMKFNVSVCAFAECGLLYVLKGQ